MRITSPLWRLATLLLLNPSALAAPPSTNSTTAVTPLAVPTLKPSQTFNTSSAVSVASAVSGVATAVCKPATCGRHGTGIACPKEQEPLLSVSKRVRRDVRSEQVKRATGDLPSPEQYQGDMNAFMTALFAKDTTVKVSQPNEIISSSETQAWSDSTPAGLALGVQGLFGCGSIVIASRKGIWMSHIWQDGFDDDMLDAEVVQPLSTGNDAMNPALPTTIKSIFTAEDNIQVTLLSPEAVQNVPPGTPDPEEYKAMFDYESKMTGAVQDKLASLLPYNTLIHSRRYALAQNTPEGYAVLQKNADAEQGPEASADWVNFVNSHALGHVLTVFSPTGSSANPAYRVYLGDTSTPIMSDDWSASNPAPATGPGTIQTS